MKNPITVDFETDAIEPRPKYPPEPVGVAIKWPGKRAKYFAWGHPSENNSTYEAARAELVEAWGSDRSLLFHNSKFDLDVAREHFGLDLPSPMRIEDSMLLGFLNDPHSKQIGLKPLGERLLGRAPAERDALREWVLANVPGARQAPARWGAHISKAPGGLVGRYAADGDAEITAQVWAYLRPKINAAGMGVAYLRERRLIPVLLDMERRGIHVDVDLLETDVERYTAELDRADKWIRRRLGAAQLNVDSNDELADAVERAGKLRPEGWELTEKGNRSVSKENFAVAVEDRALVAVAHYRSLLATCLGTFMRPWLATAQSAEGKIFTQWNAVAQPEGGGTRTGRFSSTPNFQNAPTEDKMLAVEAELKAARLKFLPLPRVRRYIMAPAKRILLGRDYAQQEPRLLAHFEDDRLAEAYQADPRMDVYVFMLDTVKAMTGIIVSRKQMKILVLAIIYGLGVGHLAERLDCTVGEARNLKAVLMQTFPGINELAKDLKLRSRSKTPMRTWGGRVYYAEEPKIIKGQVREFGYKLVNYLIQGSAADITKEAMIRYYHMSNRIGELILTVHDELVIEAPHTSARQAMEQLRVAMEELEGLDIPLLSDGEAGYNWGEMEDF